MDPGSTAVVVVVVVVVAAAGEEDALLAVSGGMPGVGTRNHKVVMTVGGWRSGSSELLSRSKFSNDARAGADRRLN